MIETMNGSWLTDFMTNGGVAQSILWIAMAILGGLLMGKIKILGFSLGVTWILFVGLFMGHFTTIQLDATLLRFVKELGLILFVYSIGIQVGPGFFSSLKNGGLRLNMLAGGLVVLDVAMVYLIHLFSGTDLTTLVGIMSGAVTNTPGLGAAQQAYTDVTSSSADFLAAGYAIAYPMGVVGVILTFVVLRKVAKDKNATKLDDESTSVEIYTIELQNPSAYGKKLGTMKSIIRRNFVVTRLYHTATQSMEVPNDESVLCDGDRMYIVSSKKDSTAIEMCLGFRIDMDLNSWDKLDKMLTCKKITVTKSDINGKTMSSLKFREIFGVNISRVIRAGISLVPDPTLKLQVGDAILVVGEESAVQKVAMFVGNSSVRLNDPFLIPIFLGIVLGVILGLIPFDVPFFPQPVKLGLAGGPLIIAILISRFGGMLKIVTYTTHSAKKMLQDLGLVLFLAAVGLGAGNGFVETFMQVGLSWFVYGLIITIIPLIIILLVGRLIFKYEIFQLMGLLSGGMTDPPALAFANSMDETERASLSYATVYPLTMFLRVMAAQFLILMA